MLPAQSAVKKLRLSTMLCKDCTEIYCFYRDEVARTACYYEAFAEPFTFMDDKDLGKKDVKE